MHPSLVDRSVSQQMRRPRFEHKNRQVFPDMLSEISKGPVDESSQMLVARQEGERAESCKDGQPSTLKGDLLG